MPTPVKVEAPGVRVDLNCHAMPGARAQDFLYFDLITWPPEQLAPRHMSQNGRARVGNCRKNTFRLLFAIQLEPAVHARDNKIEAREDFVRIIQRAIQENVRLDPLEDAETILIAQIETVDLLMLLGNLFNGQA